MTRSDGAIALARTGKTHEEIAKALGVSRVAVSHWIAGTNKPTTEKRDKLFELFNVPIDAWEGRGLSHSSARSRTRWPRK